MADVSTPCFCLDLRAHIYHCGVGLLRYRHLWFPLSRWPTLQNWTTRQVLLIGGKWWAVSSENCHMTLKTKVKDGFRLGNRRQKKHFLTQQLRLVNDALLHPDSLEIMAGGCSTFLGGDITRYSSQKGVTLRGMWQKMPGQQGMLFCLGWKDAASWLCISNQLKTLTWMARSSFYHPVLWMAGIYTNWSDVFFFKLRNMMYREYIYIYNPIF